MSECSDPGPRLAPPLPVRLPVPVAIYPVPGPLMALCAVPIVVLLLAYLAAVGLG
jgi:hypothetical protein